MNFASCVCFALAALNFGLTIWAACNGAWVFAMSLAA